MTLQKRGVNCEIAKLTENFLINNEFQKVHKSTKITRNYGKIKETSGITEVVTFSVILFITLNIEQTE